jgi:hypothetical protein
MKSRKIRYETNFSENPVPHHTVGDRTLVQFSRPIFPKTLIFSSYPKIVIRNYF